MNTLETKMETLSLPSLPRMSKKEALGLANPRRKWELFIQEIYQALFEPLSYKFCLYRRSKGKSYGGHRSVK